MDLQHSGARLRSGLTSTQQSIWITNYGIRRVTTVFDPRRSLPPPIQEARQRSLAFFLAAARRAAQVRNLWITASVLNEVRVARRADFVPALAVGSVGRLSTIVDDRV